MKTEHTEPTPPYPRSRFALMIMVGIFIGLLLHNFGIIGQKNLSLKTGPVPGVEPPTFSIPRQTNAYVVGIVLSNVTAIAKDHEPGCAQITYDGGRHVFHAWLAPVELKLEDGTLIDSWKPDPDAVSQTMKQVGEIIEGQKNK